ncbi:MAG: allantoinase AllB, partial [Verrucomicrobiota bacterium]
MTADLVLRRVKRPADSTPVDLVIHNGRIAEVSTKWTGEAREEIDAAEFLVMPGFIDAHVHLNEPGRTDWEGLETGTSALAAGGVTAFCDMPLNSSPPVLNAAELERKRALAQKKSRIDFGLWGGLTPDNVDQIDELAKAGAIAIKAFLCESGLDDYRATDRETLRRGAEACARHGVILGTHAESPEELARIRSITPTGPTWRDYVASRPESVEVEAIRMALEVAAETGCKLHVVHVTAPEAVLLIRDARLRGVDATCETCPHYLVLDETAMERSGPLAKCAPPLRPKSTVETLWQLLAEGHIHTIGSDHSPSPPEMKTGTDFSKLWGGIAGCQHAMPLFLQAALQRGFPLEQIARLTSASTAERFRMARKGSLEAGFDADLVLLRQVEPVPIRAENL